MFVQGSLKSDTHCEKIIQRRIIHCMSKAACNDNNIISIWDKETNRSYLSALVGVDMGEEEKLIRTREIIQDEFLAEQTFAAAGMFLHMC